MAAITSFCIPRMDTRSLPGSVEEIKTFVAAKFKAVIRLTDNDIDIIAKYTDQGYLYYTAFIHPKHPSDIIYDGLIKDINDTGKSKVYFDKWFWIVRKSTAPRPSSVASTPGLPSNSSSTKKTARCAPTSARSCKGQPVSPTI
jgi:hypothetical protein